VSEQGGSGRVVSEQGTTRGRGVIEQGAGGGWCLNNEFR